MTNKNVYVIGPTFGIEPVFREYGFTPFTDNGRDADLISTIPDGAVDIVCWMGGSDISPELYNQKQLPITYPAPSRDEREVRLYRKYKDKKKLGICRGAQLINVLNNGSMYQDVNNHGSGTHTVYDTQDGKTYTVCSVHHQLMIPAPNALVVAHTDISTRRENDNGSFPRLPDEVDPEVLWIAEDQALLFQGHPEFGPKPCTDYFFHLVERYIK